MFEWKKVTIDEVIETVKAYGRNSWIFNDDGTMKDDVLCVDILPLLEDLKEDEVEVSDDVFDMIVNDYDNAYNTYNWGALISNDMEIRTKTINGTTYTAVAVHLSGDVRCNYSNMFVIEGDGVLVISDKDTSMNHVYFAIDGHEYVADVDGLSDTYMVYDADTQCDLEVNFFETEVKDLIEEIKSL